METRNTISRPRFSRQSAKCLIFDGSAKFSMSVLDNLIESLGNLVVLTSNIGGATRVPFLSVAVVTDSSETLLPIQHVRGNFSRIESALDEARQILGQPHHRSNTGQGMEGALQEVCSQFRRQVKATLQTTGLWCQLEIIIFTYQNCTKLVKHIESFVNNIDLEYLKRIQVVGVAYDYTTDDITSSPMSISSDCDSSLSAATMTGIVDSLTLDSDPLSIDNYLRGWLHDSGSDCEHIHILLPNNNNDEEVVIKCDLTERILHPNLLPYTTAFCINWSGTTTQSNTRSSTNSPVYKMKVIGVMNNSLLCDSVVFGTPMIAQPTACWKLEWTELEKNQQSFQVLCSQLQDSEQVLICEVPVPFSAPTKLPYHKQESSTMSLKGHFVLLPSANGTLLVKSLAVSELTLPCERFPAIDAISSDIKEEICTSLSKIEVLTTYNPLTTKSNLYSTLKANTKKVQATKPVRQAPQSHGRQAQPIQQNMVTTTPVPTVNRRLFNRNQPPKPTPPSKRFCPDASSQGDFPTEL